MEAGELGFTVLLFVVLAMTTILLLAFRRNSHSCGYAELGGPVGSKYITAFILIALWCIYIILASLQAYSVIDLDFDFYALSISTN